MNHHEVLINYIKSRHKLVDNDQLLLRKYFEPLSAKNGEHILKEGSISRYLFYQCSGNLRLYSIDSEGHEITNHINSPHGFITPYASFLTQQPSSESLECIGDCELLRISKVNLDLLTEESQNLAKFNLQIIQESTIFNENRSKDLASLTAEQKYRKLLKMNPKIVNEVPLKFVASYLGIQPESLSRIRKKISNA